MERTGKLAVAECQGKRLDVDRFPSSLISAVALAGMAGNPASKSAMLSASAFTDSDTVPAAVSSVPSSVTSAPSTVATISDSETTPSSTETPPASRRFSAGRFSISMSLPTFASDPTSRVKSSVSPSNRVFDVNLTSPNVACRSTAASATSALNVIGVSESRPVASITLRSSGSVDTLTLSMTTTMSSTYGRR